MDFCCRIQLNLSKYCVETEIRRQYHLAVAKYFRSAADKSDLEKKIELLKRSLEHFDFSALRNRYPELSGGYHTDVYLENDQQNKIRIRVGNSIVLS